MLQVLLIWFVPESPRYLVSKGKDAQALKTLAYYHADGNAEDPLVRYEFEEIKAAIEFDQTGLFFFLFSFLFFVLTCPISRFKCHLEVSCHFTWQPQAHEDHHCYCFLLSVVRKRSGILLPEQGPQSNWCHGRLRSGMFYDPVDLILNNSPAFDKWYPPNLESGLGPGCFLHVRKIRSESYVHGFLFWSVIWLLRHFADPSS